MVSPSVEVSSGVSSLLVGPRREDQWRKITISKWQNWLKAGGGWRKYWLGFKGDCGLQMQLHSSEHVQSQWNRCSSDTMLQLTWVTLGVASSICAESQFGELGDPTAGSRRSMWELFRNRLLSRQAMTHKMKLVLGL